MFKFKIQILITNLCCKWWHFIELTLKRRRFPNIMLTFVKFLFFIFSSIIHYQKSMSNSIENAMKLFTELNQNFPLKSVTQNSKIMQNNSRQFYMNFKSSWEYFFLSNTSIKYVNSNTKKKLLIISQNKKKSHQFLALNYNKLTTIFFSKHNVFVT